MEGERKAKKGLKRNLPPATSVMSSKKIRKQSGEVLLQYPANPGYHGSGDEKQLNPEE